MRLRPWTGFRKSGFSSQLHHRLPVASSVGLFACFYFSSLCVKRDHKVFLLLALLCLPDRHSMCTMPHSPCGPYLAGDLLIPSTCESQCSREENDVYLIHICTVMNNSRNVSELSEADHFGNSNCLTGICLWQSQTVH